MASSSSTSSKNDSSSSAAAATPSTTNNNNEQQQEQQHPPQSNVLLEPALAGDDRVLPYACPYHLQQRNDHTPPPVVWHGSSMSLIARATTLLNDEFNEIDPEQDFEKWRTIGARPYFLTVLESDSQILSCCCRILLDGDWSNNNSNSNSNSNPSSSKFVYCKRRLIVDYLVTIDECQGRGYASHLLDLVMKFAAAQGANCYVLALEDSCVYWMSKGFILEQDKPINKRLNVFPDAHLLKLPSNAPEDPADFPVTLDSSSSEEEEEEEDGEDNNNNNMNEEEDDDLQRAIMMSLGH